MSDKPMVLPNMCSIHRDTCEFNSRREYLKMYKYMCQRYSFKARVDGGWMFFKYANDYDTWRRQR